MRNNHRATDEAVSDPMWLDEHRYLTVWAGHVIEVDIRQIHPLVPITEQLMRDCSVDASAFVADALRRYEQDQP